MTLTAPSNRESMRDLVIWGGTGNFKVLCELLHQDYRVVGFFDNDLAIPQEYRGIRHLGNREAFHRWVNNLSPEAKPSYIVSIGPGHGRVRLQIHEELQNYGLQPITAVHRTSFVAPGVPVGTGTQIYARATVCTDAVIGKGCILNTNASIDHECTISDGATIGPGATLAGLVTVGACADIYTGAVILPRVRIGEGAIVGAGAVVLHDVPPNTTVVGNPARIIRRREHGAQ